MNENNTPDNHPDEPHPADFSAKEDSPHPFHVWCGEHQIALIVSTAALVIAVIGTISYPSIINWRVHSLAAEAQRQAENKDWKAAVSSAVAAFRLRPADPAVLRCVATIMSHEKNPTAFQYWQLLLNTPEATMEDRRNFIESSLGNTAAISKIDDQIRILLDKEPGSSKTWLLNAKFSESTGDPVKMLLCARKAHELDASDDEATLYLSSQLMKLPDSYSEGFKLLWTLVEGNGKKNLDACVLASHEKELSDTQMDRLIECIKKSPDSTVAQKLAALWLEIRKHPDGAASLLDNAVKEYRSMGKDALHEFGSWLNNHGVSSWTLSAIPPDVAKSSRDLFVDYVNALISLKKWAELDAAVSEPGVPLEAYRQELLKARCDMEMGKNDDAIVHWRSAQSAAVGSPEQEFFVAGYARLFGRDAQAESIYRSLTVNPSTADQAYKALLEMAGKKNTASVRSILAEMVLRWPKNTAIQNDFAYYSLLLGEELTQQQQTAVELVNQSPSFLSHRSTLALAFLRLKQPEMAMDVYKGLEIKWDLAPARYRAVYAAVLNANGKKEEALKMTEAIQKNALLPEERELLNF